MTIAAKWLAAAARIEHAAAGDLTDRRMRCDDVADAQPGAINLENEPSRSTDGSMACSDGGATGTVSR